MMPKTIWSLIVVISICVLFFFGIQDVSNEATINNLNLNNKSLDKISKFNKNLENLTEYEDLRLNTSSSISNNQTNLVEEFYREVAEKKNTIERLRDSVEFIYDIPNFFLLSIPFVDMQDQSLTIYKNIFWFLLSLTVIVVLYKAIFGGQVD